VYGTVKVERKANNSSNTITIDKKIPYPHLASFISKHLGGEHFGKRMRLKGIQDSKQLLEDQTKQMIQKKQKDEIEKAGLKMKDYQDMLQLKEEHIRDEIEREVDNKSKQLLFKQEMQQMHQQKILKQQQEKAINDLETYDYFPYTHGENIDNMQENYRRIVLSNRAYQNQ